MVMRIDNQQYERAKEQIITALIHEYMKKNPGTREQDVVMLNHDGKLIFSDLSSVLAEMKVRKDFDESVIHTEKMSASLAVQENHRWQQSCQSSTQSKLMVDCLNSSPFNLFDKQQWSAEHEFIRRKESASAKATVKVGEYKENIVKFRDEDASIHSSRGRTTVIYYLQWVIQQLRVLHQLLGKELELSDIFQTSASQFIEVSLEHIERESEPYSVIDSVYQALTGNGLASVGVKGVGELNRKMLVETKKTLSSAVEKMLASVEDKRKQFHAIWASITTLTEAVKGLEELNRENASEQQHSTEPTKPVRNQDDNKTRRMARFSRASR